MSVQMSEKQQVIVYQSDHFWDILYVRCQCKVAEWKMTGLDINPWHSHFLADVTAPASSHLWHKKLKHHQSCHAQTSPNLHCIHKTLVPSKTWELTQSTGYQNSALHPESVLISKPIWFLLILWWPRHLSSVI